MTSLPVRSLVHHRPSGPPLSARLAGVLTQVGLLLRGRLGRLAGAALLTTTVVGLVLAIPVVSGAGGGGPAVTLDAASSSAADDEVNSPVVMGLDGRPLTSSSFAGVQTTGAAPTTPRTGSPAAEDAPAVAAAPDTTGSAPIAEAPSSSSSGPSSSSTSSTAPSSSSSTSTSSRSPSPRPTAPGTSGGTGTDGGGGGSIPPAAPEEESPAQPAELPDAAAEALALVNAARTDAGCAVLAADSALTTAAGANSAAMSASGLLGLDGLVGAVAQDRPNAQSAVAGWLGDQTDSATILDCSKTSAGIAAVDGWWTLLLA